MSTISERVQRGTEWLDRYQPGWIDRVHVERLEMASVCRCVLGQIFGDFYAAPIDFKQAASLGFDASPDDTMHDWVELGGEWRRVITERRAAA